LLWVTSGPSGLYHPNGRYRVHSGRSRGNIGGVVSSVFSLLIFECFEYRETLSSIHWFQERDAMRLAINSLSESAR